MALPLDALDTILQRELHALARELEAYPDDASVWREVPGVTNTAGTLALHVAGNLQHYVGAVLGGTGYVRDRAAEFARRGATRAELLEGLRAAGAAVRATLARLGPDRLAEPFPEEVAGVRPPTDAMLIHLACHLAYHLGQVDYHRRVVTGSSLGVGALATKELVSPAEGSGSTPIG